MINWQHTCVAQRWKLEVIYNYKIEVYILVSLAVICINVIQKKSITMSTTVYHNR